MTHLTHIEWKLLKKAWIEGNVDDQGSAFGEDADSPRVAAEREGYEVLAIADDGSVLAHSKHKHYYLVCMDNGPWGVDVTTAARSIIGDEISSHA
jgi:hypothetical protein